MPVEYPRCLLRTPATQRQSPALGQIYNAPNNKPVCNITLVYLVYFVPVQLRPVPCLARMTSCQVRSLRVAERERLLRP